VPMPLVDRHCTHVATGYTQRVSRVLRAPAGLILTAGRVDDMGTGACFRSLDNAADGANTGCLGFRAGGSGVMMLMISISYRRLATLAISRSRVKILFDPVLVPEGNGMSSLAMACHYTSAVLQVT